MLSQISTTLGVLPMMSSLQLHFGKYCWGSCGAVTRLNWWILKLLYLKPISKISRISYR